MCFSSFFLFLFFFNHFFLINYFFEKQQFDFLDFNSACPIEVVYGRGCGAALLEKPKKLGEILLNLSKAVSRPITVKLRTGRDEKTPTIHSNVIPFLHTWGVSAAIIHGRSRQQRYSKLADWDYIGKCSTIAKENNVDIIGICFFYIKYSSLFSLFFIIKGNGDILSFEDYELALTKGVATTYIARGALIKPWIFTEIKERRHWFLFLNDIEILIVLL